MFSGRKKKKCPSVIITYSHLSRALGKYTALGNASTVSLVKEYNKIKA